MCPSPNQGYVEKGDKDSLNDEEESGVSNSSDSQPLPNNLLNYINPRGVLETSHSYCFLWIVLSSFYGQLLLILMVTFTLIEVMDNNVKLLSLQGIYLMYLYVGGIVVIICIYIWVLLDSCASFRSDSKSSFKKIVLSDSDLGKYSLTKFGSLKRAHLSRDKTSATSFYLRIGALAFGIGTLVFNGLEMAMHSMMEGPCLNDVVFVHPVLHGLFTFLQMHFLFVNSQVLVERFGLIARFGFMHLAATNLALWVRLIVWESGIEWTYFIFLIRSGNFDQQTLASAYNEDLADPVRNKHFPRIMTTFLDRKERDVHYRPNETVWAVDPYRPISDSHISQVVALHQCLNTNSLGQLWTSSMPFLYPFIVQFSLIAAGVTYVMGQNVGRDRMFKMRPVLRKSGNNNGGGDPEGGVKSSQPNPTVTTSYGRRHIDCTGASKGLFLGLLCLVAAIVVIIIFLVVKEDDGFPIETLFWVMNGTQGLILALSLLITLPGIIRIKKLSYTGKHPTTLDSLLSTVTLGGVQLYSVFGIVIGACSAYIATPHSIEQRQHLMLVTVSAVQLIQAGMQSTLIEEGLRRGALTRHQHLTTPGRQVVTFLLCSNVALWAMDSFVTQNWFSQELQLRFMGVLAWGVLSRISLPLLVFYRFHSGILLLEIWQRAYNNNLMDSSNI